MADDKTEQFKKELGKLFKKYDAQLELEEEYTPPYGCSTYKMVVYIDQYSMEQKEINLSGYFDGDF